MKTMFTWDTTSGPNAGVGMFLFEQRKHLEDVVEGLTRYLLDKDPGTVVYYSSCRPYSMAPSETASAKR